MSKDDREMVSDALDSLSLPADINDVQDKLQSNYGVSESRAHVMVLQMTERSFSGGDTMVTGLNGSPSSDDMKTSDATDDSSTSTSTTEQNSFDEFQSDQDWESVTRGAGQINVESPEETADTFFHVNVREDQDHPMVPDTDEYFQREKDAGVSVVEDFTFKANDSDYGVSLIGEPGTGKGHLVKYVCSQANIPLARVNFGIRVTKEKLVGGFVPKNNGNGLDHTLEEAREMAEEDPELDVGEALSVLGERDKFSKQYGLLALAVKNGWWFLADELNGADPEALFPFYGLLEDKGSRTLEIPEFSETIEPHPGFRFVSTMNPTHHRGTKGLNHALKDRMYEVQVDYLEPTAERKLLTSKTDLDQKEASNLVQFANSIRNAYPDEISRTLTPRGLFRIARLAKLYSLETAAKQEMIEGIDQSLEQEVNALERKIENASF